MTQSSRIQSPVAGRHDGRSMGQLVTFHLYLGSGEMNVGAQLTFSSAHCLVCPTLRAGLPSSVKSL